MNFATLAGVYMHARNISRTLSSATTVDDLQRRLAKISGDPRLTADLLSDLMSLESHLRVMGFDETVTIVNRQ